MVRQDKRSWWKISPWHEYEVHRLRSVNDIMLRTEHSYRQHGFCPLSMASLQQLDAVDVVANLDQVSHQELGSPSLCPSGYLTTAHHVGLCQHCWVKCPSVNTYMKAYNNWDGWVHQLCQTGFGFWECVMVCGWSQGEKKVLMSRSA